MEPGRDPRVFHRLARVRAGFAAGLATLLVAVAPAAGATPGSATDPLAHMAGDPLAHMAVKHVARHHHHRRHHRRHRHHARHARVASTATSRATVPVTQPPVAAAGAPAVPAVCPDADTPAGAGSASALDAAVVCLINQQRVSRGLPALLESPELNRSAQSWSDWMVSNSQFTHGSDFSSRISAVGYDWQAAGENIATGFGTPREVVTAWMASPDHCRNILDPSFRDVGTGVNPAPVPGFAGSPATWTQDFGLLMSQNPLSADTGPQSGCPYA